VRPCRRCSDDVFCDGFSQLALTEIWAEALETNVASLHILRRLGMTEAGPGDAGFRRFVITGRMSGLSNKIA
jgi:RimJ/RimL family protein N-acetyltransferase